MSQTADRYAKALFESAKEQNSLEAVEACLSDIRKLILDLPAFRLLLSNPLLSYDERCATLKAMFTGKIPDIVLKFLLFITYKSRLDILKDMIDSFDAMYLIETKQIRAYVKTALPMNDTDKDFVNQRLNEKFHQKIITKWTLDPSLIGGFRIFAQGKIYDYSFKNQLDGFLQQTVG